jgi:hypothetical protein
MSAHPIGRTKKALRLRTRAFWLCLLTGLFAIATLAPSELREVLAQSSSPQATSQQDSTSPAQDAGAPAHLVEPAAKQEVPAPPTDPQRKQILDDSANLFKLANSLKAEVDKTTADTLSVSVIRQADEIAKLAKKMRGK